MRRLIVAGSLVLLSAVAVAAQDPLAAPTPATVPMSEASALRIENWILRARMLGLEIAAAQREQRDAEALAAKEIRDLAAAAGVRMEDYEVSTRDRVLRRKR